MNQPTTQRPRVIIDCDPGHDDAIAILCAAAYGQLVGITTVSGNVALQRTTINALMVAQVAELDVEVHAGADRPLVAEPVSAPEVHGQSGLDGPEHPPLERLVADEDATTYLLDTAADDIWLVPTGPLTNIALALQRDATFLSRFAGVVLMGGSAGPGNVTATAEFNIWADAEAAAQVFAAGAQLSMVGLNLTHQVRLGPAEATHIRGSGTQTGRFVADMIDFFSSRYQARIDGPGAPIHDACAVLRVTHPELFVGRRQPVVVETAGTHTRGMTVIDHRPHAAPDAHVEVVYEVEAARAVDLIVGATIDPRPA